MTMLFAELSAALPEHPLIVLLDDMVALTRYLFQSGSVDDDDRSSRGIDDSRGLETSDGQRYCRPADPEGGGEIVMCEVDAITAAAIKRCQQPTGQALFG